MEKPGTVPDPIAEKTKGGRKRSAQERTIPMFPLEQLAPHEAEARAMKERKAADRRARNKVAKAKRERTKADDDRKVVEFNERTGTK
jgi:hypothetical protein